MDKKRLSLVKYITIILCVVIIAVSAIIVISKSKSSDESTQLLQSAQAQSQQSGENQEEILDEDDGEIKEISHIKVGSAGDILIHKPILEGAKTSNGYDFSDIFTIVKKEIEACDYFVANLEVTLGGEERGYSTYPRFNTPDAIVQAAKNAGIDCLLTSNNHCYDTNENGLLRTLQVVEQNGFDHTGTRNNVNDKNYLVKDVQGVKIGMFCATYETESESGKAINGILTSTSAAPLINSFDYSNLDLFYSTFDTAVKNMKNEGADIIVVYPHWGEEYQLKQNSYQTAMAQRMCELGADIIIGGHPHVVQPVEFVQASNGRKAVCLYSMGNFVSNQRRNYMPIKDGHTEDGAIFEYEITKYSDGSVKIDSVKVVPTWVNLTSKDGKKVYQITPLSANVASDASSLGLSSSEAQSAEASYSRTMALVEAGLKEANDYYKTAQVLSDEEANVENSEEFDEYDELDEAA